MSNTSQGSDFLQGPFAPTRQDGRWDDLEVRGEIPQELCGTLYRTGSEPQFDPVRADLYHWFDGDGVIGGITLKDGRASFQRRVIDSDGLAAEKRAGHAIYGGINGGGHPQRPHDAPPMKNTGNTNVTVFGDKLLAFMEMGLPYELKKDDLRTLGSFDFGGVKTPVTAHWKVDPDNGDLLFYGVFMTTITWYRADRFGQLVESHSFDMGVPSFIHDFAVTKDFAIFFINPTIIDVPSAMRGERPVIWAPEVGCRIAVLNRHTFSLKMIAASDRFAPTHFLNAWQDGKEIVVDGNRATEMSYLPGVPASQFDHLWFKTAYPWRWRINPAEGTLRDEQISDINSEFPRHNESLVGKAVQFGYYAATRNGKYCQNWLFDNIAKHDFKRGTVEFQNVGGQLSSPGESVFVARRDAADEDDGWVLTLWYDPEIDQTELVILNGQDFSGQPQARIKLGRRFPMGFHGNWVAEAA